MTDPEPGAPAMGPPARPPGPVPAGYVPREWLQQQPPPAPAPQPPSPSGTPWSTADAPPAGGRGVPFLDTPWVPPRTPRQAWYWLIFAVAGFVVGQLAATIFAFVAGALEGKTAAQMQAIATQTVPPEWYVVSTLIGLWIGFLGAPWLASRTQGTRHFARDLGVRFRWIDLIGIAPAAEELFFRGLLLKSLVRLFTPLNAAGRARAAGVVLAVIADGLLFGAAHGEWVQFAGLAGFGIVLAAVSYRTGRLGMNTVAHATFNLMAILSIAFNGGVILFR